MLTAYRHIEVVRGCDASVLVPFVATAERPERATFLTRSTDVTITRIHVRVLAVIGWG